MPRGGGRFSLTRPDGHGGLVRKVGDPVVLRREARGGRIAGHHLAPRVASSHAGALETHWIDGPLRALTDLVPEDARSLGRLLRRVHAQRATATGGLPGWAGRARTLRAYARGRARDALARADGAPERALVERATDAAIAACPPDGAFAFLHGDLVASNILWPAAGPVLVDWEFWRMGDPAEDLAYLEALNDLPGAITDEVRRGYGATRALATRIDAWHALVLVDAALWHGAHGDPRARHMLMRRARGCLPA